MPVTKLFKNGGSQAVRIPKEFRFDVDEVEITKKGASVVLTPVSKRKWPKGYWESWDALNMKPVEPLPTMPVPKL